MCNSKKALEEPNPNVDIQTPITQLSVLQQRNIRRLSDTPPMTYRTVSDFEVKLCNIEKLISLSPEEYKRSSRTICQTQTKNS